MNHNNQREGTCSDKDLQCKHTIHSRRNPAVLARFVVPRVRKRLSLPGGIRQRFQCCQRLPNTRTGLFLVFRQVEICQQCRSCPRLSHYVTRGPSEFAFLYQSCVPSSSFPSVLRLQPFRTHRSLLLRTIMSSSRI